MEKPWAYVNHRPYFNQTKSHKTWDVLKLIIEKKKDWTSAEVPPLHSKGRKHNKEYNNKVEMKSMVKEKGLKVYLSQDGAQWRPRSRLSRPYNCSDHTSSIQLFHRLGCFRYLRHCLPHVWPSPLPVGKGNYWGLLNSLKIQQKNKN